MWYFAAALGEQFILILMVHQNARSPPSRLPLQVLSDPNKVIGHILTAVRRRHE